MFESAYESRRYLSGFHINFMDRSHWHLEENDFDSSS